MVNKRSFFPEILIHPWETLKDILESEEMSQKDLCLRTDISEKHISNIIQGKANITPETALILEKVFGMSAEFWNNLQKAYDEDKARIEEKKLMTKKIELDKDILAEIKDGYKNLADEGFVEKLTFVWNENKERILNNLYSFFWVSSLKNILDIFKINTFAFKKSESLKLNKYNLACWLRAGELKIKDNEVNEYSKKKLDEILKELKSMTNEENVDVEKIKELLASAWINFSFVPSFTKVPVYWITRKYKWIPFIQVSDRWKRNDSFWFALFHELAHVQLHLSKKDDVFINVFDEEQDIEAEANNWASNYFIDSNKFEEFIKILPISEARFLDFAKEEWIWTSLLAWRIAHYFDKMWHSHVYGHLSDYRKTLNIINN
jgi:HTH-type transcriptional regulator / antitoxin HigA